TEDQSSSPMMRILQLNLNHCKAAQDLLSQTILEQRINVAVVCDQHKNLDPPYTWLADANSQAAIWVQGGGGVQEHPARARPFFTWARINGIYLFSVYAPPRLADVEFSALLINIIEKAWEKRPLIVAGDFNAWATEWGCRKTWQRGSWPPLPVHATRLWPSQVDDAVVARCTGGQARSPITGAHACEREGLPREHGVGQMKAPAKRAMPPQDVSCALLYKTSKRLCWSKLCDEVNEDVWGKPSQRSESKYSKLSDPSAPHSGCPLPSRA
ncbi:unnamed protein product, partial [Trichogramma brassicae]